MKDIMKYIKICNGRLKNVYIYPILFFAGTFIHIFMEFYLKLSENTTEVISVIIYVLIAVFIGINYINCLRLNRNNRKRTFVSIAVPIIGTVPFIISLFFDINLSIINLMARYIIFAIPMYCLAVILVLQKNNMIIFIRSFKIFGVIIAPFSIFYICRICLADQFNMALINYKNVNYMSIAYMLMPIIVALLIELYFFNSDIKIKVINCLLVILFWVCMLFTGTRGAILCIFCSIVLFLIYDIVWNKHKKIIFILQMIIVFGVIYFFIVNVWSPKSSGANFRLGEFNHEQEAVESDINKKITINYEDKTIEQLSVYELYLKYIVISSQTAENSIDELQNGSAPIIKNLNEDERMIVKEYDFYFGNRLTLYKLALMEFEKKPIFGNGLFYYQNKMGTYPHNIVLECLCDIGIVGTVLFLTVVLMLIVLVVKKVKYDYELGAILILIFSYVPQFMVSGTIYFQTMLVFAVSYAFAYVLYNNKEKEIKNV